MRQLHQATHDDLNDVYAPVVFIGWYSSSTLATGFLFSINI